MRYSRGNLTESPERIIIHGCNSQGKFNAGVAKDIRKKWPEAYRQYIRGIEKGHTELGSVSVAIIGDNEKIVANLITQTKYGRRGQFAKTAAIRDAIRRLVAGIRMNYSGPLVIASSKIGCGYGGLRWSEDVKWVFHALEEELDKVEFVIYDLNHIEESYGDFWNNVEA